MSTQEREQKEKLVFSVSADDIDRIEISREKGTVACARDKAGDWNLEKPLLYKADKARIRGMLSRLEGLKSERVIPGAGIGEKKIEEFGLKEPRLTCLLYTSDAADDLLCVDLGGRRIIKKTKQEKLTYEPRTLTIPMIVASHPT